MPSPSLRKEIENGGFITAPGVFELISALIADRMGFKALYVTGYGTVASALGLPDAGLASYSQMVDRVGRIAEMTKTPVIADADTGYGGLLNVRHTVRGYEQAGVTARSGDRVTRKPSARNAGIRRTGASSRSPIWCARSRWLLTAGRVRIFWSSRAPTRGQAKASTRRSGAAGRHTAKAGADGIYPAESPETEAEMAEIGRRIDKPLLANMVNGGRTPMLPGDKLKELCLLDCDLSSRWLPLDPARRCWRCLHRSQTERHNHGRSADVFVLRIQQIDRLRRRLGVRAPLPGITIDAQSTCPLPVGP